MRKTGPHELLRFGEGGCGKRKQYFWMAKAGALSVALALCPVPKVQAASFDCGKATSEVEKMICAEAELSNLDEEMKRFYIEELKKSSTLGGIKVEQRLWLKDRNRCPDAECLKAKYRQRLASFNKDVPVYATIYPPDMFEFKVNCSKAESTAEMIICEQAGFSQHQRRLIGRDEYMRSLLQWALMRTKDKRQLIESQQEWVENVRNSCTDIASCMVAYDERNLELVNMMERPGSCYTLKPLTDGNGHVQLNEQGNIPPIEPVCQAMEENLNQFCDQPPMACDLKVAPRFREQITFPDWVPLDPEINLVLIEEVIRAPWEDSVVKGAPQRIWEERRPKVEAALAAKSLTFFKAQLDLYNLGREQLAYRLDYGTCKKDNPQLDGDLTQWRDAITPSSVEIHHAPEVIRPLFKEYFPLDSGEAHETFLYGGQTFSYVMGPDGSGDNKFLVNRHERWTIPGEPKVNLSMHNLCWLHYQPIKEEAK